MLITKTKKVKINFRMKTREIATFCGVTMRTVQNWRTGKSFPTPANIAKLEELAKVKSKK